MRTQTQAPHYRAALAALAALTLIASCQQQNNSDSQTEAAAPSTDVAALERQQATALLAQLGAPATAEQRAQYEGPFEATGALEGVGAGEGAWEMQLADGYASLIQPGLGQDGGITGQRNFRERGMQVAAGPLTITIRAEQCTLPNNVRTPYAVNVLFEGVSYQGCARRGSSSSDGASWASVITELMPAIDACLARATSRPARVTIASVMDEGIVSVRLREADGGRQECITTANGGNITEYGSISDIDRRAGEGNPEFVRAPGPAPVGTSCRSVTPVPGTGEEAPPLGWLVRRTC